MAGRQGRRWLARAWGLTLLLLMLLAPPGADALEWRLPGRGAAPLSRPSAESNRHQLQEVSPPAWVQKARLALEDRDPSVRVLAPADGELLPDGPWTLRLQVADWPLVDGGPLGLGPHLVVQLDEEPPRPTVDTEVVMPPLSPGSHRLTVYAAKPWGEAHKSPLAQQQIRLHRLAPNPATLPAPGTPQLIPVSPSGIAGSPPLLVDWLLIDTPLQGLRSDTAGWRLRLTVNGESVLVDQQTPLWLQGWTPGANSLLFELLDGRGEPLNAPYNSLLREVVVSAGGAAPNPARALTDLELAVLLGEQPVSVLTPPAPIATLPEPPSEPTPAAAPTPEPARAPDSPVTAEGPSAPEPPATADLAPAPPPLASPAVSPVVSPETAAENTPAPSPEGPDGSPAGPAESTEPSETPDSESEAAKEASPAIEARPALEAVPLKEAAPPAPTATENPAPADDRPSSASERPEALVTPQDAPSAPDAPVSPTAPLPSTASDTIPTAPPPSPSPAAPPASATGATGAPTTAAAPAGPVPAASPAEPSPAERPAALEVASPDRALDLPPATPSARDELNPDGTLRRPPRPSALEWLRERLG